MIKKNKTKKFFFFYHSNLKKIFNNLFKKNYKIFAKEGLHEERKVGWGKPDRRQNRLKIYKKIYEI